MSTLDNWTPVYDYGCGWKDCPECGPMIALEIEAKHRKRVANTYPKSTPVEDFVADVYGTGQERVAPVISLEERRDARASRMTARERERVKRVLTPEQREEALAYLDSFPLRKSYLDDVGAKREWLSEVWLELEHPHVKVAAKETRLGLSRKVNRAIARAQKRIREYRSPSP